MPQEDSNNYESINLTCEDGVNLLTLVGDQKKPFILSPASMTELEHAIAHIDCHQGQTKGLIIRGAGAGIFCAGADLDVLASLDTEDEISQLICRGQDLFSKLAALKIPTVAAISGTCVGGGLELALACDLRITSDHKKTKLGLPEVRLGILPAWGGSTRLVDTIGLKQALPLLLTGRLVSGRRARSLGLVADCCPQEMLLERAHHWLKKLAAARAHGHHGNPSFRDVGLSDYLIHEIPLVRQFILKAAEKNVRQQTGGHYPAPLQLISLLRESDGKDLETRLDLEHDGAVKLAQSRVAKNLISIFRRNRDKERGAPYSWDLKGQPKPKRIAVVGGGIMGSGIATALLRSGLQVTLLDLWPQALIKAKRAITAEFDKQVKRRRLDKCSVRQILDRLILTDNYSDLVSADLVIESVPEIAELKKTVLKEIDAQAGANAIICTNTSSLSIDDLEQALASKKPLYGLHFFNPAPKMPLVEIVRGKNAQEETLARLSRFCRNISKTPVVVADRPAFVVNRLLAPYLLEAQNLLLEGAPLASIEKAAKSFGFPMGPFELMDSVGLDIIQHVCDYLATFPELNMKTPELIHALVANKQLGRKTKIGFYRWRGRKKKPRTDRELHGIAQVSPNLRDWPESDILLRLEKALYQEAARIMEEGIVQNETDLDLASIFGMGFPPFTGGIASWAAEKSEVAS